MDWDSGKNLTIAIASRNVCLDCEFLMLVVANFVREMGSQGSWRFLCSIGTGRTPIYVIDIPFMDLTGISCLAEK